MKTKFNYLFFLLGAFFIQCGNHFFALGLSAFVFMTTSSVVKSSLIMLFSAVPSVFLSNYLGRLIDKYLSKNFLIATWLFSILITLLCGLIVWFDEGMILLGIALSSRSLIGSVARTSLTKWLKIDSANELQERRFRLYYFTFFLSTIFSGLLVGLALIITNIFILVTVEALLIVFGAGLLMCFCELPKITLPQSRQSFSAVSFIDGLKLIFCNSELYVYFLLVVMSEASFQGAYTVLVATLPLKEFSLGGSGITLFQAAASIGIILGFIINWYFADQLSEKNIYLPLKSIAFCILALLCLLMLSFAHGIWLALLAFLGLNFIYECVWLYNETSYFKASPSAMVGQLQFLLGSLATFMMGVLSLIYAVLIDRFGFACGTQMYVGLVGIIFVVLSLVFICRKPMIVNKGVNLII